MAGKKSDAESFASRWANKGNENQDTQRFWIDFYQNVLGVEDAVSRFEADALAAAGGWAAVRVGFGDAETIDCETGRTVYTAGAE